MQLEATNNILNNNSCATVNQSEEELLLRISKNEACIFRLKFHPVVQMI